MNLTYVLSNAHKKKATTPIRLTILEINQIHKDTICLK